MLQENTPDALCMYEIHIKDREIAVPNIVEIGDKGIFFAHHIRFMLLRCEWLYICDEQISSSSF